MNLNNLKKWLDIEHDVIVTTEELKSVLQISEPQPDAETQVATDQAPDQAPKFDQDRFERLFCAVIISSPHSTYEKCMKITQEALKQLDAYYATKGGNNG